MNAEKILIVDDDKNMREVLSLKLESEGYEVAAATGAEDALKMVERELFDLALVDLKLGGDEDGIDLMEKIHRIAPEMAVIILTAYGTIDTAVEAMQRGAYNYLTKPYNRQELLVQIRNGLEKSSLSREVRRLKRLVGEKYGFENIIGKSRKMQAVMEQVARAAETDSNVCIYGESGTGKELIAKSLHLLSARQDRPFVVVNCGAIPEGLQESELFGHMKGAFTGATRSKRGLFERADGGTLFLDEVSEMSESLQVKLLRVLQERRFYPVGGEDAKEVDVRILTATNKNLAEEVAGGRFREDLFYRIYVIPIQLPPLRERREDIPLLVDHFVRQFEKQMKKSIGEVTSAALHKLMAHSWPGNVRELENTLEYAVAMASQGIVDEEVLFQVREEKADRPKSLKDAKKEFEKTYLTHILAVAGGNVSKAAKLAGKYRGDIYALMKKYDLDPSAFKK